MDTNPRVLAGILVATAILSGTGTAQAAVQNLHVEYRTTPLGIDVEKPRFGWQMTAPEGKRGSAQTAYRIVVTDPEGDVVWDTKRSPGARALGIVYAGAPLRASARYRWTVTVWDQKGATAANSSWFETGLMDPSPGSSAWSGAAWIGGGDEDLVLYSHYLSIFDVRYAQTIAPDSTRASFVYGANDTRLMDENKNLYRLGALKDQSYIKLELDVSAVDGSEGGKARLNVYRVGYTDTDTKAKPLGTFEVSTQVINEANKHAEHVIAFSSAFGRITLSIDGDPAFTGAPPAPAAAPGPPRFGPPGVSINLNPMGSGGDYLTYGMLCDIGFSVDAGQAASFRDLTVLNARPPQSALFRESLAGGSYQGLFADVAHRPGSGFEVRDGHYRLAGGETGVFVVRDPSRNSTPMLRTEFEASGEIAAARLYVTSRGIYEVFLNGERVGNDYYNPGLTQYDKTQMYQTYDVTRLVTPGTNGIGAMLGEGWWSGLLSYGTIWNHFGDRQSLLAKLVITYANGSTDVVTTNDRTWRYYGDGPIVYASLDMGEVYDAGREEAVEGWTTAGYDDSRWKPAVTVPLQGTAFLGEERSQFGAPLPSLHYDHLSLLGQIGNSAGIYRVLRAESVREARPGVYVYDMGQNMVGVPRITFAEGHAGDRVTLRYAEMLYPDLPESGTSVGMIMTENYRAALSQDIYVMKAGPQVFEPRFTSHGYQYLEVTGVPAPLPLEAVEGVAISSIRSLTADYRTSSDGVNQLWSNLVWSNVDNFLTLPTDCPQRNERMGWSGDISVFSRTATYVSNADPFLTRHMYAMRDVQAASGRFTDVAPVGGGFGGILWGSAGIVVPWEVYQQYGDLGLLEQHYPAMAAYVDYLQTTIDATTGLSSDAQLGDWLGPQNDQLGTAFLATAYHAFDLDVVSQVAALLGKTDDAQRYRELYLKRKAFFNSTFVNADRKTVALVGGWRFSGPAIPVEMKLADTQTSYAVPLALGVFSEENLPYMVENLAETVERENRDDGGVVRPEYSLMTGFIGTAWISKALSDGGRCDLAYRLLENRQYPSWLYAVDQGATTIWERLNGYTVEAGFGGNNSMNSFNHYSFGAVGQWMMAYSLGIQRDQPGFQRFILQPEPDPTGGITSADGYYDSMYGRIRSAWNVDGDLLRFQASVPANTTATLYLPAASETAVREGGEETSRAEGVAFLRHEKGKAVYELKAGDYEFTAPWQP